VSFRLGEWSEGQCRFSADPLHQSSNEPVNAHARQRFPQQNGAVPARYASDGELLDALRAGDEAAFRALVTRHHRAMVRVAAFYVGSSAVAEEVTQDTWLAVITGLDGFEARSSLKTWIFRILVNQARTRGTQESRTIPFSSIAGDDEPTVDPGRFRGADDRWAGHWAISPSSWSDIPAERLEGAETRALVNEAIRAMPHGQRTVITLRDIEGLSADQTGELLDISEVNQRVLLHRARGCVRAALEAYFEQVGAS
jgi:RNA polymerase sigma-70 factor (ECF subfamily)